MLDLCSLPDAALQELVGALRAGRETGEQFADYVQTQLDASADINQSVYLGATLLHYACEGGLIESVRLLLKAGAAVNQTADNGATPLYLACVHNHSEIAGLLQRAAAHCSVPPLHT